MEEGLFLAVGKHRVAKHHQNILLKYHTFPSLASHFAARYTVAVESTAHTDMAIHTFVENGMENIFATYGSGGCLNMKRTLKGARLSV